MTGLVCPVCKGPVLDAGRMYCCDDCRYTAIIKRRDQAIARRKEKAREKAMRPKTKPKYRAVVTGPRGIWRCDHRHRTRKAALVCARRHHNPMDDLARAERWDP